jgi:hypothetical protein
MISPAPSTIVPPHSSAQLLLRLGQPFTDFPRFSILDLRQQTDLAGNAVPFSEWLTKRLQIGTPFVIEHFDQLDTWDSQFFKIEKLIELSTKKSEPPLPALRRFLSCTSAWLLRSSFHRHTHPKLQLWPRPQFYLTQVRRLCAPVLSRVPESLRSRSAMPPRMARAMSQDLADRSAVGWAVGPVPVAAPVRQE